MGVCITAYENVELIEEVPNAASWEEAWERAEAMYVEGRDVLSLYNYSDFQERGHPLVEGLYDWSGESHSFSMSYGSYNYMRELVSESALGCEPKFVWERPDLYQDKPMFELVHFADNEGFLGPETCFRLAIQSLVVTNSDTWEDWYRECFNHLLICLNVAANRGVIVFS